MELFAGNFNPPLSERASKRKRNSRIPETPIKGEEIRFLASKEYDYRIEYKLISFSSSTDEEYVPKPKLKKIERKLVPVLEKLVVEELTETNPYQKFNQSLERVFENVEDMDISLDVG